MNPIQTAIEQIYSYVISAFNITVIEDKKQIRIFIINDVLSETERFIMDNLNPSYRSIFNTYLSNILRDKNSEEYMTLLLQNLEHIPNYEYLLEGRMNGLKIKLLQELV
jgi:hypothetical protein